jgi:glycosyltransferase involved in cell wall biosynthesis
LPRRKVKLMFVIPEMTGGGAERILLDIMKNLDRTRFDVSLILFQTGGEFFSEIPENIPIHDLKESRHYRMTGMFRIILKLYGLIKKGTPDLIFSVINVANFIAIPAAKIAGTKVIAYEVSNPYLDIKREFQYPFISMALLKITYPRANVLLALSEGIKNLLISECGMRTGTIRVSYTPFDLEYIKKKSHDDVGHPWLHDRTPIVMGVGALVKRKGFHVLLEAFSEIRKIIDARLIILGEGEMKEELDSLAGKLQISDCVYFAGFDKNPWKYLRHASVFVLSSEHEGFGNVIVEAMICGVPVVSTDCPVGPREILKDGECGLLVRPGDSYGMAEAVKRLIGDEALRRYFIQKGYGRAMEFDKKVVMGRLESLIESTVGF